MGKNLQVSKSTISNIWRSHNLKPHRVKSFNLSRDTRFLEKLTDLVGLYLNPPQQALVLCIDEKSQIQALDRTQPGLPLEGIALVGNMGQTLGQGKEGKLSGADDLRHAFFYQIHTIFFTLFQFLEVP